MEQNVPTLCLLQTLVTESAKRRVAMVSILEPKERALCQNILIQNHEDQAQLFRCGLLVGMSKGVER